MGPPHPLSALPGSNLQIEIKLDQSAKALRWRFAGQVIDFRYLDERWRARDHGPGRRDLSRLKSRPTDLERAA